MHYKLVHVSQDELFSLGQIRCNPTPDVHWSFYIIKNVTACCCSSAWVDGGMHGIES